MPSSLRRVLASRANGARSPGPSTPEGKLRSAQNATRHGLLARCIVMDKESHGAFEALWLQHLESLQPVGGVELGMVEEMVAAYWRMRRAWAIETRILQDAANVPAGESDPLGRIAAGFSSLANSPALALMHRYETRLHLVYQRSLHNLLLLRALAVRNEPSPISGHSGDPSVPAGLPINAAPNSRRTATAAVMKSSLRHPKGQAGVGVPVRRGRDAGGKHHRQAAPAVIAGAIDARGLGAESLQKPGVAADEDIVAIELGI